jgi:transcriptional regulator with XRE-family HTH domain
MTPILDFARRLKALRATRDITQAQLAKRSGVSHSYISRIEIGMQSPTLEIIEKLAAALKVKPSALLEYPRKRSRSS